MDFINYSIQNMLYKNFGFYKNCFFFLRWKKNKYSISFHITDFHQHWVTIRTGNFNFLQSVSPISNSSAKVLWQDEDSPKFRRQNNMFPHPLIGLKEDICQGWRPKRDEQKKNLINQQNTQNSILYQKNCGKSPPHVGSFHHFIYGTSQRSR